MDVRSNTRHDIIEKRADVAIVQTRPNKEPFTLLLDATYTHAAAKYHGYKYNNPGSAADFVTDLKRNKVAKYYHMDECETAELGILAFETTGVFSKETLQFCKFLTMDSHGSSTYSEKMMKIKQSLSVSLVAIRAKMMEFELNSLTCLYDPRPMQSDFRILSASC
jgi:hypothetical protein